jgi:hypothetical protein
MITRVSSVIRPKGSDLIFDHPYKALPRLRGGARVMARLNLRLLSQSPGEYRPVKRIGCN